MTDKNIIKLVILHLGIGILIAFFHFFSKIYTILIVLVGVCFVIKNQNKNNEVLYAISYLVGSEVFLRTTSGSLSYELGKYFMLLFTVMGIYFSGIPEKRNPYWIFLLFILPGIFIPIESLQDDIRKKILFDILGPFCLGVCALYTYKRKITSEQLHSIIGISLLPVVACTFFLMIKFPYYDGIVNCTESNFYLSGGFAPNQMATVLGLATFICFTRIALVPASKKIIIVSLIVFCLFYYRGLMTFSRGGIITSLCIIAVFSALVFLSGEKREKIRQKLILMIILLPVIFFIASYQTDSILYRRYVNKNVNGLPKGPEVNGRKHLIMEEIKFFKENPMVGMGVGRTKEIRRVKHGSAISNHNEITRLLAEHGLLGVLSLIILLITPLLLYKKNKKNIFLLAFLGFWLLTINHSATRIAAPVFIYALALLQINFNGKDSTIENDTV